MIDVGTWATPLTSASPLSFALETVLATWGFIIGIGFGVAL